MKFETMMKSFMLVGVVTFAAVANAALWDGLAEENYVSGPKITERDLLGKVVLYHVMGNSDMAQKTEERLEALWKSYDRKRFYVLGCCYGDAEASAADYAKRKLTFPVYKGVKLASDSGKRDAGSVAIVNQYGRVLIATTQHSQFKRDDEIVLVDAITSVGLPPTIIPGVSLEKYKPLKNSLKLGKNLKSIIKTLEKDVEAANKKTATAQIKAKADEASSILSAIKEGKSDVLDSVKILTDANPAEALSLLSLYVKSFPEEASEYKEKLDELKVKVAEFKKQK